MFKIKYVFILALSFILSGCTVQNTPNPPIVSTPTPVLKYQTWTDAAGFNFEYPDGVTINNHPEDTQNYSNLTLTDIGQSGTISILMQDDIYKTPGTWITKSSAFKNANIIDTQLGGKDAKKILTTDGNTVIGVIDSGVLVTLQKEGTISPLLESAWSKITDSWVFVYPTPAAGKTAAPAVSNDSGDVLEEF